MKGRTKMKCADWSLLATTIFVLISSVQLEATGSISALWVWLHIVISLIFLSLICWHIYLHFKWNKWKQRLFDKRRGVVRWMSICGLCVILSACAATIHWIVTNAHNGIGGVHGKIGFIFLVLIIIHIIRHRKFYTL